MHLDLEAVRVRVNLGIDIAPGMPAEAERWATVAAERELPKALAAHRARIPGDLLLSARENQELVELPRPWGEIEGWETITSDPDLDALLPPLER